MASRKYHITLTLTDDGSAFADEFMPLEGLIEEIETLNTAGLTAKVTSVAEVSRTGRRQLKLPVKKKT